LKRAKPSFYVARRSRHRIRISDNLGMEIDPEQFAGTILGAISLGRDLYLYDHYIGGPNHLECARKVLTERRDACSDPAEAAFLTSVLRCLENRDDPISES
jgi:hypothetical protein